MFTGSFIDALIVHWTKLFWIGVILYKNKTSPGAQLYFFLLNFIKFHTIGQIFSCWLRKEDLHYSISKRGNEMPNVYAKSRDFLRKKWIKKWRVVMFRISRRFVDVLKSIQQKKKQRKHTRKDSLQLIWPFKYGTFFWLSSS